MRKALLVGTLAATLVAATAASVHASTPAATSVFTVAPRAAAIRSVSVDAQFAALAATLPACTGSAVTNCRYGTPAKHLEASVQSPTATIYFEMRAGVVTVLQVYPVR